MLELILHFSKLVIWGSSWGRGFRFHWLVCAQGCLSYPGAGKRRVPDAARQGRLQAGRACTVPFVCFSSSVCIQSCTDCTRRKEQHNKQKGDFKQVRQTERNPAERGASIAGVGPSARTPLTWVGGLCLYHSTSPLHTHAAMLIIQEEPLV